jgi:hypothetical protein
MEEKGTELPELSCQTAAELPGSPEEETWRRK